MWRQYLLHLGMCSENSLSSWPNSLAWLYQVILLHIACSYNSYLWKTKRKFFWGILRENVRTIICWRYTSSKDGHCKTFPWLTETSVVVKPSIKNKYYVKFNIAETILPVYLNVPVSGNYSFIFFLTTYVLIIF
jgi:hypothetical protein